MSKDLKQMDVKVSSDNAGDGPFPSHASDPGCRVRVNIEVTLGESEVQNRGQMLPAYALICRINQRERFVA